VEHSGQIVLCLPLRTRTLAGDYCTGWKFFDQVADAHCSQTQGIDDVHRATAAATDPEIIAEGKKIVEELARLKYELQHDRQLT